VEQRPSSGGNGGSDGDGADREPTPEGTEPENGTPAGSESAPPPGSDDEAPVSKWFATRKPAEEPAEPSQEEQREEPPTEAAPGQAAPSDSEPGHNHHAAPAVDPVSEGRSRLLHAIWPPRFSRNQVVVGVLLAVLGAALAIQVRATNSSDQLLRAARPDDLVHILDEVTARGQRLDTELRDLESQKAALQNSTDKAQAALQQAQEKAKDLQILAGTTKATGPGITVTISDPQHKVNAGALLNTLQELRAAGAEVVQLGNVRIVVSSAFLDNASGQVSVDGHNLNAPYVFKVIGDPATLQPALGIPGGVVANMKDAFGATTTITSGKILVDAVAPAPEPQFAKAP
jgi:uncharacterized protein YlxW (UPF0749 family)